jgi:O-methyltransferase involved in polyketide biosynthesis
VDRPAVQEEIARTLKRHAAEQHSISRIIALSKKDREWPANCGKSFPDDMIS